MSFLSNPPSPPPLSPRHLPPPPPSVSDTAFIDHKASLEGARGEPGQWYFFDDSKVIEVPLTEVVTPHAYIVIYARQNK
jgi:hypothetical protein